MMVKAFAAISMLVCTQSTSGMHLRNQNYPLDAAADGARLGSAEDKPLLGYFPASKAPEKRLLDLTQPTGGCAEEMTIGIPDPYLQQENDNGIKACRTTTQCTVALHPDVSGMDAPQCVKDALKSVQVPGYTVRIASTGNEACYGDFEEIMPAMRAVLEGIWSCGGSRWAPPANWPIG